MDRNVEYVFQTAQQRNVSFTRLWCVDVLGTIKGVAFPISELEAVLEHGVGFDGSALEGGTRRAEHDAIARPDVSTFQVLPWRADANVARMFTSIELPDGRPFDGDSREVLRRVVAELEARGLSPQIGSEVEFYLLKNLPADGAAPEPLAAGGYYDLTPHDISINFRRSSIGFLEQLGIPVRASYHEAGPCQQEVVIAHADPVASAEAVITTRMAMKQAAFNHGAYASFMPKPLAGQPGSALHVHVSLFGKGDLNLFHDPDDPSAPLSALGRAFLAGVLRHAPEYAAVASQWVNSYTRLADGHEAPNRITWSRRFANPLVRVPEHRPDADVAKRIEVRLPDAGCNPYLVFALILAAGLKGIDGEYELPAEVHDDAEAAAAPQLPLTLRDAVAEFERSELVRETLGERLVDWFVRNKQQDIDAYARQVTDFELRQSLPQL
ncbi:MAG: glutamine synthetase family protein [Patulibacter minatonensis]